MDGVFSCFFISSFPYEDDVGVLTKVSADNPGKGKAYFGVDLGLPNTTKLIFYGIFNGKDIFGPGLPTKISGFLIYGRDAYVLGSSSYGIHLDGCDSRVKKELLII